MTVVVAAPEGGIPFVTVLVIDRVQVLIGLGGGFRPYLVWCRRRLCRLSRHSHVPFRYRVGRVVDECRLKQKQITISFLFKSERANESWLFDKSS